jgi:hypothetical protein
LRSSILIHPNRNRESADSLLGVVQPQCQIILKQIIFSRVIGGCYLEVFDRWTPIIGSTTK